MITGRAHVNVNGRSIAGLSSKIVARRRRAADRKEDVLNGPRAGCATASDAPEHDLTEQPPAGPPRRQGGISCKPDDRPGE